MPFRPYAGDIVHSGSISLAAVTDCLVNARVRFRRQRNNPPTVKAAAPRVAPTPIPAVAAVDRLAACEVADDDDGKVASDGPISDDTAGGIVMAPVLDAPVTFAVVVAFTISQSSFAKVYVEA